MSHMKLILENWKKFINEGTPSDSWSPEEQRAHDIAQRVYRSIKQEGYIAVLPDDFPGQFDVYSNKTPEQVVLAKLMEHALFDIKLARRRAGARQQRGHWRHWAQDLYDEGFLATSPPAQAKK